MATEEPLVSGNDAAVEGDASDPTSPSLDWSRSVERVLDDWRIRAWAAQVAHYRVASHLRAYNVWLGLPVVVFTTAVGTSLFATMNQADLSDALRIVVGSVAVVAAILAGIQTFLNFAQRADQHVLAADWYASIRRKIEQELATPKQGRRDPKKFLDEVRKDMNTVGSQFPEIGERAWNQVAKGFGLEQPIGGGSWNLGLERSATGHTTGT
jgi:hypothetical protein